MKRFLITALLLITFIGNVLADDVTFVASAPKSVVVNQHFKLSYTINTTDAKEPVIQDFKGFEVLSGPNPSTRQSYSSVNGNVTTSVSVTFTYILLAKEEGTFTIPAASIKAAGKELQSNSVTIKVLPEGQQSSGAQGSAGSARQSVNNSTNIGADDLFVRAIISKSKVYEQEAVLLTYKVYSMVNLTNLSYPAPELKGFNIQEVELPQNKQFELEHYNGRNYNTVVWRQYVLFPQQSGELEIPAVDFEAVVAVQSRRSMDPFEMMFNGFSGYVNVNKNLRSNSLKLNVERLPEGRPADFSGAVGDFTISSNISSTDLKTNSEFTLKVAVKGAGNMRLMGNPVMELPVEFEAYDPVVDNNFRLASSGFKGEKVYEYLITPKASGTYTIPGASFTFFNPNTKQYQTIESTPYEVKVAKGEENSATVSNVVISKERGKVLATDIRHIKFDNDVPQKGDDFFFTSSTYILMYVIPSALLVLLLVIYRKKVAENANVSLVRTKKANKVAVRRLKLAKRLMAENKVNEFYDEILKAMWGYTSDKLCIPVSQLSKENIANELAARGVSEELISEFKALLNEGEFARYAPGDKGAAMDKVYTRSVTIISKMENSIK